MRVRDLEDVVATAKEQLHSLGLFIRSLVGVYLRLPWRPSSVTS